MATRIATTKVPTTLITALARAAGIVDGLKSGGSFDSLPDPVRNVLDSLSGEFDRFQAAPTEATDDASAAPAAPAEKSK